MSIIIYFLLNAFFDLHIIFLYNSAMKILVTSGGTSEAIDSVRSITNTILQVAWENHHGDLAGGRA